MKDLTYTGHLNPETVLTDHLGTLKRYPIWAEVPAGTTVKDGWSQPHTAPNAPGTYTLFQFVQDASLQGFEWVRDNTH